MAIKFEMWQSSLKCGNQVKNVAFKFKMWQSILKCGKHTQYVAIMLKTWQTHWKNMYMFDCVPFAKLWRTETLCGFELLSNQKLWRTYWYTIFYYIWRNCSSHFFIILQFKSTLGLCSSLVVTNICDEHPFQFLWYFA